MPTEREFGAALVRGLEFRQRAGVPETLFNEFVRRTAKWLSAGAAWDQLPLLTRATLRRELFKADRRGGVRKSKNSADDPSSRRRQIADTLQKALFQITELLRNHPLAATSGESVVVHFECDLSDGRYAVDVTGLFSENRHGSGFPEDDRVGLLARFTPIDATSSSSSTNKRGRGIWHLPQNRSAIFKGRTELLEELRPTLDQSHPTIHVITGIGGVGKSLACIEYAYRNADLYDVVWWLRASDTSTLLDDYRSLGLTLNAVDATLTAREATEALRGWLETSNRWLLVFDNARDAEQISQLLPRFGKGHVLITSTNPAWRSLANVHELGPLPTPDAVALLQERSGTHDDMAVAEELATALGCLPLALVLAGAYIEISGLTFIDYLRLFRVHRESLLRDHDSHMLPLVATWLISINSVRSKNPFAATLLAMASHLGPAPIPRAFFERWIRDLGRTEIDLFTAISDLRRYSLLSTRGADMFVHRLLAEVTLANTDGEHRRVLESTALRIVAELFRHEGSQFHESELGRSLFPHIMTVTGRPRVLSRSVSLELLTLLALYFDVRGSYDDAVATLDLAAARFRHGVTDDYVQILIAGKLAAAFRSARDHERMFSAIQHGLDIVNDFTPKALVDYEAVTEFLTTTAAIMIEGGEPELAVQLLHRVMTAPLEVRQSLPSMIATAIGHLANAFSRLGRHQEAIRFSRSAVALQLKTFGSSHPELAVQIKNLGGIYRNAGMYENMRDACAAASIIFHAKYGDLHPVTIANDIQLAAAHWSLDGCSAALRLYDAALMSSSKTRLLPDDLVAIRSGRALALEGLDRIDEAMDEINAAIELADELGISGERHQMLITHRQNISEFNSWKNLNPSEYADFIKRRDAYSPEPGVTDPSLL